MADVSGEPSGTLTPTAKKYNFDGTASTATDPDIELNKTVHITEHLLRTVRQNLQRPLRLERNSRLRIFLHPRVRAKSYSDQTWDKFPVGYIVGKDGTTFTITYKWRSSGSGSDYDYSTSTRGKATNVAGKSGRWILEGGEFTEDNGTTQEDTCTIYWHEIDGKWYYFNTASDKGTLGAILANTTTPDGYQVDANGAWIR